MTIVSITHHDPIWEKRVPEVTFRWTLHLSKGDDVDRSWTPDPGYEKTFWTPERIAAGTPFWDREAQYTERWFWDSDPVYGPHPLQHATIARARPLNNVGSGTTPANPGPLPPSGYMNTSVIVSLKPVRAGTIAGWELWYELWYALGSMSMQDQRALYETLLGLERAPDGEPSERSDYLVEFLLTTQPRWTCRNDVPCHLA